ncbi:MAG TPA: hypothetical protein VK745_07245 [Polyangiaceae bacterium]|nr:hypothetical protein [Polyangiaceae bacterium]
MIDGWIRRDGGNQAAPQCTWDLVGMRHDKVTSFTPKTGQFV